MAKALSFLIGRACSFTATPCTFGADGTITELSAFSMAGRLEEVTRSSRNTTENISPMDCRQANPVITETETTLNLVEILQNGTANNPNLLQSIADGYDYVKFVFARAGKTGVLYGNVGEYSEGLRKGKSTGTLTVNSIALSDGNGGYIANPSVS